MIYKVIVMTLDGIEKTLMIVASDLTDVVSQVYKSPKHMRILHVSRVTK